MLSLCMNETERKIRDGEHMGITETCEMIRVDEHNPGTFEFMQDEDLVLFIADVPRGAKEPIPHMVLRKEFASNATRIAVVTTILE